MYDRVLIPVDDLKNVSSVVREAVTISSSEAALTILHVVTPVHNLAVGTGMVMSTVDVQKELEEDGKRLLVEAKQWLPATTGEHEIVLRLGDPASEICKCADEEKIDLIVMGRRDKGPLGKLLLGSVSQKVVQNASCSVLVVT